MFVTWANKSPFQGAMNYAKSNFILCLGCLEVFIISLEWVYKLSKGNRMLKLILLWVLCEQWVQTNQTTQGRSQRNEAWWEMHSTRMSSSEKTGQCYSVRVLPSLPKTSTYSELLRHRGHFWSRINGHPRDILETWLFWWTSRNLALSGKLLQSSNTKAALLLRGVKVYLHIMRPLESLVYCQHFHLSFFDSWDVPRQ